MTTLAIGLSIPSAAVLGGGALPDFYVDSVSGSDANDGTSEAQAFATLGKTETSALALGDGVRLAYERGSSWSEEIDLSSIQFALQPFGSSAVPYIDAAGAVVETWTQPDAGTYPNVWAISVTHGFSNNQTRLPIWEDGTLLTRVTSLAACNSTEGTFYSPSDEALSTNDPATVNIHATGSGNPNTNGKTYEIARREYALKGAFGSGDSQMVTGPLKVGRQAHNDGAITLGDLSSMRRVWAFDGHKHNVLQESGSATDCIFKGAQNVGGYLHVFYSSSGAGKVASWNRCGFIGDEAGFPSWILGAYNHDDSNGHDSATITQCWFVGCSSAVANASSSFTCRGSYFLDNTEVGAITSRSASGTMTLKQCMVRETTATRNNSQKCKIQVGGSGTWTVEDTAAYFPSGSSYGNDPFVRALGSSTPTIVIRRNAIVNLSDAMGIFRDIQDAARTYTITNNVLVSAYDLTTCVEIAPTGIVSEIDYNVYYINEAAPDPQFDHGSGLVDFATWQAQGYDTNSIVIGPSDISLDDLFLSGSAGVAAGDFRLATDTGLTFADGTPIHEAGPTSHWDWASGASSSGAPTAWPSVPVNDTDCETYIAGPWTF